MAVGRSDVWDEGWTSSASLEAPSCSRLPAQVDAEASGEDPDTAGGNTSSGPHELLASQRLELVDSLRRRTADIIDRNMQTLQEEVRACSIRIVDELHDDSESFARDMSIPFAGRGASGRRGRFNKPGVRRTTSMPLHNCGQDLRRMGACASLELMDLDEAAPHVEPPPTSRSRQVFCDPAQMKDQVRKALVRPQYNVTDMYKTSGMAQCIARSQFFEGVTLFAVLANSIWQAVEADLNQESILVEADPVFQVMEHGFCLFFLCEWSIRLCAFKRTSDAFKDRWFFFDTWLIGLMVFDTWVLAIIFVFSSPNQGMALSPTILRFVRILRLTRMARMARLLHWMPELVILLKGLWHASKSVICTLILLLITLYLFGLAFKQLTGGTELGKELFPTVANSMMTLMLRAVLPDVAQVLLDVAEEHWGLVVLLFFFILLAYLTVMNLLVGVLVEVVSMVSRVENEAVLVNRVRSELLSLIQKLGIDLDGNGTMSKDEFEAMLITPMAAQFMQDVGVDVVGLVEYTEYIFKDKELEFHEFVELILQLRGSNLATVKDIVDMRKAVMQELESISSQLPHIERTLHKLPDSMHKVAGTIRRQSQRHSQRTALRSPRREEQHLEQQKQQEHGLLDLDDTSAAFFGFRHGSKSLRLGRRRSIVFSPGDIDRRCEEVGESCPRTEPAAGDGDGERIRPSSAVAAVAGGEASPPAATVSGSLNVHVNVGCQAAGLTADGGRTGLPAGITESLPTGTGPGNSNSTPSCFDSPVTVGRTSTSPTLGRGDHDIGSLASLRFASRSCEHFSALPGMRLPPLHSPLPASTVLLGNAAGPPEPSAVTTPELAFFKDYVWSLPVMDPLGDPGGVVSPATSPTNVVRSYSSPRG